MVVILRYLLFDIW